MIPAPAPPASAVVRFPPGTTLAGRYRIVAPLGRGGMGEVFRADDLKLGQPVALKFLPHELTDDPDRVRRLLDEVRIARQVTHPNVCRVYDIGEADGAHFLTMEYIEGENLAALLQQVGRLPEDRGIQIARQVCLGLAAAHDKGVLHRDLKPANVMIDSRGQVHIADFGLAAHAEQVGGPDARHGTPAYQAPEQLAGQEATARSDLYALGLVLYELFTGRRPFQAASRDDLARLHAATPPPKPSSHVTGLDPAVEKIILRCLEKDPQARPKSALAVAAALPGGDPLAAALAAGEVPSPELVANAGGVGGLHPLLGMAALAAIGLGIVLVALLNGSTRLFARVPLELTPAELSFKARGLIKQLGYTEPPADSTWGIAEETDSLQFLRQRDGGAGRWQRLETGRPAVIYFWYRQSTYPLTQKGAALGVGFEGIPGRVTPTDPPPTTPGMVSISFDFQGRLIGFLAAPAGASDGPAPPTDWDVLFREAGLDRRQLEETPPTGVPPVYADVRAAWAGVYPQRPEIPVQVEAAAYRGRAVFFRVGPELRPVSRNEHAAPDLAIRIVQWIIGIVIVSMLTIGALLARYNIRLGRANRQGAFRLAVYFFAAYMFTWMVGAKHVPLFFQEGEILSAMLGLALFEAGQLWLAYLALEPYVRRRWPGWVVSWNRLLAGRWRDPLVGRDLLVGVLFGVGLTVFTHLKQLAQTWFGLAPLEHLSALSNPLPLNAAYLVGLAQVDAILPAIEDLFLILLLFLLLRREWAALAAFVAIWSAPGLGAEHPFLATMWWVLWSAGSVWVLRRAGFLVYSVGAFTYFLLRWAPLTTDLGAWYAGPALLCVLLLLGLAVYGFVISLAGRPLLGERWLATP
jgi:serine/threonine-protein kinase